MIRLEQIRIGLEPSRSTAERHSGARSRAGVAIVLAGAESGLQMCFMQRVTRRGDRWSGDIALPGGWARADEATLCEAAMRETHEEVGLALHPGQHFGDVPPLPISRYQDDDGIIGASVFHVGEAIPSLTPEPGEVADAFWVPLSALYDTQRRTSVRWSRSGPPQPRPAIGIDDRVIWGLTYRVLVAFSSRVFGADSPLPPDADQPHEARP